MRFYTFAAAMLLTVIVVSGCASHRATKHAPFINYPATVEALERWTLTFGVPGAVTERWVPEGSSVVAGQGLALLSVDAYESRVRDTQAALQDAIDHSESTAAQLTSADLRVVSPGVSVSSEPTALRERVLQAVVKTAKADSEARQAQWAQSATVLRADRSGTIARWLVKPGDVVNSGAGAVELEDDWQVKVVATAPNEIARELRIGRRAVVTVVDASNGGIERRYDAEVRAIDLGAGAAGVARVTLEVIERATLTKGAAAEVRFL